MATTTDAVENYEPSGDPEHVSYASDFYWTCTCGASAGRLTKRKEAEYAGEKHEQYCFENGDVTVRVNQ